MSTRARYRRAWTAAFAVIVMTLSLPCSARSVVRARCVAGAAAHYGVHPALVRAVLRQEGGTVGRVSVNRNGTYDIGPMQINSSHLPELARFGISKFALLGDECLNIYIGTWLLKSEIVRAPSVWTGVGNYHSHTPALNVDYQWKIWHRLVAIERGG